MSKHTPGPWQYVPTSKHHGPYITSDFGNTICDCYVMSQPSFSSTANGGPSEPILFLAEMADPNARLIAAAPDLLTALELVLNHPLTHLSGDMEKVVLDAIAKAGGRP